MGGVVQSPASTVDVRDRDREHLTDGITDQALYTDLEDAWTLLQVEVPDAADASDERLRLVLSRMVLRHLSTPGGRTVVQESETRGPMTASRSFGASGDGGGLRVLAEDVRVLRGLSAGRRQRAFSVDTSQRPR